MSTTLMEVRQLVMHFPIEGTRDVVRAVDGVDLSVSRGETLGLVGESGCGKTTLGRLMVRLLAPTAGQILYAGRDIAPLSAGQLRPIRSKAQIIFQDPFSSLNPRMMIQTVIERPIMIHTDLSSSARRARVDELLERVGLNPEQRARYPHEFSGGQRQRVAIARALAVEPEFIVLDEPTSALDVSIQAQILNLLKTLQQEQSLTCVFISHDLSVVRHMSDRIAVMYLGQIVEVAPKNLLFAVPLHPYTRALISAVPTTTLETKKERLRLAGDVPSSVNMPAGCRFHTRCPFVQDICLAQEPALRNVAPPGQPEHLVRCHLV